MNWFTVLDLERTLEASSSLTSVGNGTGRDEILREELETRLLGASFAKLLSIRSWILVVCWMLFKVIGRIPSCRSISILLYLKKRNVITKLRLI